MTLKLLASTSSLFQVRHSLLLIVVFLLFGQERNVTLGAAHEYFPAVYSERQPKERFTFARSGDTKTGGRFVESSVRVAHEVATVLAQKLITDKI